MHFHLISADFPLLPEDPFWISSTFPQNIKGSHEHLQIYGDIIEYAGIIHLAGTCLINVHVSHPVLWALHANPNLRRTLTPQLLVIFFLHSFVLSSHS